METQEHILAKADIRKVPSKKMKIIRIVYLAVVAASLIIGIIFGTHTYHSEGGKVINKHSELYGQSYPAHDDKTVGWFSVEFSFEGEGWKPSPFGRYWGHTSITYKGNIIWVLAMYVILLAAPFVIGAIQKRQCKNTALVISETKVYGSYNSFLFKKSLKMPIEKVDNLTTISGLMDKLRTGVTLGVCSASGIIKIHFVQNAEEVVSAAMSRIDEIKEKRDGKAAQTAASVLTSDKLKDLLAMKESGLINDEEFTKKREKILSDM